MTAVAQPATFCDFIVYVDESGDHHLAKFDPDFPLFVLTFCIFRKDAYVSQVVPALQRLKFKHFGHDMVVFHEREIHKAEGPFAFLTNKAQREEFMTDVGAWVESSPFVIIAVAIRKPEFAKLDVKLDPYHIAMKLGLERVEKYLRKQGATGGVTHIVFESRGKREDRELREAFDRVCGGDNYTSVKLNFQIVIPGKQINCSGMQLADLTARPIGRYVLNPAQKNRAFDVIRQKLDRSPEGILEGCGLKCYP